MRIRQKIFIGAMALVMPASSVVLLATPASAKKPLPNPITCDQVSGTVNLAGNGLSVSGFTSTAKTAVTTVDGITLSCPGAGPTSAPASLSVTIKNEKNAKVKGQPRTYTYGTFLIFMNSASAIKKSIKSVTFTVNGNPVLFQTKGVAIDTGAECPGEVGFILTGKVKLPPYNVSGNGAELRVCLGADSGTNVSGTFGGDFGQPGVTITSATIDPETSEATL